MCDNTVSVAWALPEPDTKIDHYILEHRRTNHEGPPRIREDYPWMVLEGIRELEHTLTGRTTTTTTTSVSDIVLPEVLKKNKKKQLHAHVHICFVCIHRSAL